jgi:predicted RNase H-like HicB family nuclease
MDKKDKKNKDFFQQRIEELLEQGKTYEEAVFEASEEINKIIKKNTKN